MKTLRSMFLSELCEMIGIENRLQKVFFRLEKSSACERLAGILGIQSFEATRRSSRLELVIEEMGHIPRSKATSIVDEMAAIPGCDDQPLPTDQLFPILFRIEHYLLATYGCLRDWAALLGNEMGAARLQESYDEIRAFDATLVHQARAEAFDPPLKIDRQESARPLARLLSKGEMAVLHWLADGVARKHARPAARVIAPASLALRMAVSSEFAAKTPVPIEASPGIASSPARA